MLLINISQMFISSLFMNSQQKLVLYPFSTERWEREGLKRGQFKKHLQCSTSLASLTLYFDLTTKNDLSFFASVPKCWPLTTFVLTILSRAEHQLASSALSVMGNPLLLPVFTPASCPLPILNPSLSPPESPLTLSLPDPSAFTCLHTC